MPRKPHKNPDITDMDRIRKPTQALKNVLDGSQMHGRQGPRRLTDLQRLDLHRLGMHNELPFTEMPPHDPDRQVYDDRCDVCNQVLPEKAAVCYRCGNCVFCGTFCPDKFGNACLNCGNHGENRLDETNHTVHLEEIV